MPTFRIPRIIRSDDVVTKLGNHFEINLKRHRGYHPQSTGLAERTNSMIKTKFRKKHSETVWKWPDCLDIVQLSMLITPSQTQSLTPLEALYGRPYLLPDLSREKHSPQDVPGLAEYLNDLLNVLKLNTVPPFSVSPQVLQIKPGDACSPLS